MGAMISPVNKLLAIFEFQIRRAKLARRFKRDLGCAGNFENPRSSQEKIQFRKLYGNHEFYAGIADKYEVRQYITDKIGASYLIPLLGVYDRLTPDIIASLPERFIIKANHGSGWNRIVQDKSRLDVEEVIAHFSKILGQRFGDDSFEKHYDYIKPRLVIEELLEESLWGYSLFCYNGPAGFDFSITLCSPDKNREAHYDGNWNFWSGDLLPGEAAGLERPANFDEMIAVARALAADFDFVRVDLYSVGGRIYFGELTLTPASGLERIPDEPRNTARSTMWTVDFNNPRLYRKRGRWLGLPVPAAG